MGRDLDIIVFGATGFTGKHTLPILHKLAKANNRDLKWGVAGRSEKKLKEVLKEAEKVTGTSLANIPVIVADVANEESLKDMASKTRIVVNCCGPYRHFGEPVVKACISEGTHHVDVSGEPFYMENMQYKYHAEAQEKGVYIISACGFDSIPTDIGVVFLQQNFPGTSLANIPVIVADVANEESLKDMASKTRIVVNCCGPYRHFGEPVVKACISEGTHHVDVSGEPFYMENMQYKYHAEAQEKGVYIISACGFDSIPTDIGVVFLQQNFPGTINSVVTYLEGREEKKDLNTPGPMLNYGTWESIVFGLAYAKDLKNLRQKLYPSKLPKFEPELKSSPFVNKTSLVKGWALPFLGSDRPVVTRSQRYFYEQEQKRPAQIQTYFTVDSLVNVIKFLVMGIIFGLLAKFKFGREVLLKYPEIFSLGLFSHESPSEERLNNQVFSITICGEGWKDKLSDPTDKYAPPPDTAIVAQVKGRNPGYGATCVCLVLAAIVVLTETDKMPAGGKGGVYPPGAAFAHTSLIKQLQEEKGLEFEILTQADLKKKRHP